MIQHPQPHLFDAGHVEGEPSIEFSACLVSDRIFGMWVESGQRAEHKLAHEMDDASPVEFRTSISHSGFSQLIAQTSVDFSDFAGLEHGFHKDAQ